MILQRFNPFTNKLYEYDVSPSEASHPMYNALLHSNEKAPEPSPFKNMCGYCYTIFESRNKLFYHLGFHGIDVRNIDADRVDCEYERRKNNHKKWWRYKQNKIMKKQQKKRNAEQLEDIMKHLQL